MDNDSPIWIRKLISKENFYNSCFTVTGCQICTYLLTYVSIDKLKNEDVETAFHWLFKKVPSLRLKIVDRGGETWFAEMNKEQIDFQVLNEAPVYEEVLNSIQTPFDLANGPNWRAKLIHNNADLDTSNPNVTFRYPYECNILLSFNHTITDGTSNLKICELFFNLVNQIIGKVEITDCQIGEFTMGEEHESLLAETKMRLDNDPQLLEESKKEIANFYDITRKSPWLEIPNEIPDVKRTLYLYDCIDPHISKLILKQCQHHKISVNSYISAVIYKAVAEVLNDEGLNRDSVSLRSYQSVNFRQFWENNEPFKFGLNVGFFHLDFAIEGKKDFWPQACRMHTDLRKKITSRFSMKDELLSDSPLYFSRFDDLSIGKTKNDNLSYDFFISNLGNADNSINLEGKHVSWCAMGRVIEVSQLNSAFGLIIQTFNGKLEYTFSYCPKYVSVERMEKVRYLFNKYLYDAAQN